MFQIYAIQSNYKMLILTFNIKNYLAFDSFYKCQKLKISKFCPKKKKKKEINV